MKISPVAPYEFHCGQQGEFCRRQKGFLINLLENQVRFGKLSVCGKKIEFTMKMDDGFQVLGFHSFIKLKGFLPDKIEIAVKFFKVILSAIEFQHEKVFGIMPKDPVDDSTSQVEIKFTGSNLNGLRLRLGLRLGFRLRLRLRLRTKLGPGQSRYHDHEQQKEPCLT